MKKNTIKKLILAALAVVYMYHASHAQSATGLNFDGIDDRCTVNDNAAYNLGTGNFTVEAWVKIATPQLNSSPSIFYRRNGNGLNIFLNSSGILGFNIAGGTGYFGQVDMDDNICHHIALVRTSGTNVNAYVDGILKGSSGALWGSISTTANITIGYGGALKGLIHEVRFWNVARTQSQIDASKNVFLAGNETGLIGYWRMNEGSGQTINDLSATNNDGFLGTVNTSDAADPVFTSNSCMCPNPVITTTGGAVCTGQTPTLSTALIPGYAYQWKLGANNIAGATNSSYVATAAGNYQCQATAFGCSGLSNIISLISGAPTAVITAGGPTTFCTPNSVGLGANAGTMLVYQWKLNGNNINGATLSAYMAYAAGNYTCLVSNNCGSTLSNTITVTVNQSPSATITPGGPLNFCNGGSVTLTGNAGTGYTYLWKKNGVAISGATSQSYVANQGGNYTVTVTSGSCSATSGNTSVIVEQALSPTITSNYLWFCQTTTVSMDVNPGGGTSAYQWFEDTHPLAGANSYELVTGHNGNYKCSVTNLCGVYSSPVYVLNDFLLSFAPRGTLFPSGSSSACSGQTVPISIIDDWMFFNYQWLKDGIEILGENSSSYNATQTGSYACRMTDYDCNQTFFTNWFTLTVNALPSAAITPSGPTTFCSGGSVMLQTAAAANRSYQWKKGGLNISGATLSHYEVTAAGSYSVTVTNTLTGCSKTTTTAVTVTVKSLPSAAVTPSGTITFCAGQNAVLTASPTGNHSYQWKKNNVNINGATVVTYTATTAGKYKVIVTNNTSGCSKTSAVVTISVPCKVGEMISENNPEFTIFPNPANNLVTLKYNSTENQNADLTITDITSRVLVKKQFLVTKGENSMELNMTGFTKGIYLIRMNLNGGSLEQKLVLLE